jgi:hypothetical protein
VIGQRRLLLRIEGRTPFESALGVARADQRMARPRAQLARRLGRLGKPVGGATPGIGGQVDSRPGVGTESPLRPDVGAAGDEPHRRRLERVAVVIGRVRLERAVDQRSRVKVLDDVAQMDFQRGPEPDL